MKHRLLYFFLLWPSVALAATTSTAVVNPDQINDPGQLLGLFGLLGKAFSSKQWLLLAAILLTAAVAGIRMFKVTDKLPSWLIPWATIGLALLTSVAVGLQTGQAWTAIVGTGLAVGVAAVGGWETVGKMVQALIAKIRGASPPPPAPSAPAAPPADAPKTGA